MYIQWKLTIKNLFATRSEENATYVWKIHIFILFNIRVSIVKNALRNISDNL